MQDERWGAGSSLSFPGLWAGGQGRTALGPQAGPGGDQDTVPGRAQPQGSSRDSSQGTAQSQSEEGENSAVAPAPSPPGTPGPPTPPKHPGLGSHSPPLPPPGPSQLLPAPWRQHNLLLPPAPAHPPGTASGGSPGPPISGSRGWGRLYPTPQGLPGGFSSLRSSLSITPSSRAHLHRGEEAAPGAGSGRGVTPGAPGEQRGQDGAPATGAAPAQRLFPGLHLTITLFFLLFLLLLQVSHGEPSKSVDL